MEVVSRFKISKQYFERKEFPRKKAEDIIGGAEAWKNVDKMDGLFMLRPQSARSVWLMQGNSSMSKHQLWWLGSLFPTGADQIC